MDETIRAYIYMNEIISKDAKERPKYETCESTD